MIEIKNLSCGYGKKTIVRIDNLKIEKNKLTVITGPNGCGKTTFLKALAGVLYNINGEITVNGINLIEITGKKRAEIISFMPQIREIPKMMVKDFLMCARYPYTGFSKLPRCEDKQAVVHAMQITGTEVYENRRLETLSGGERQKIYFAMALAQETDIILLDEPTTYLDTDKQFEIMDLINSVKTDKTVVLVMHDLRYALKYADSIIVMNNGKVIQAGTKEEILNSEVLEKLYNIKIIKHNIENSEEYIITRRTVDYE